MIITINTMDISLAEHDRIMDEIEGQNIALDLYCIDDLASADEIAEINNLISLLTWYDGMLTGQMTIEIKGE